MERWLVWIENEISLFFLKARFVNILEYLPGSNYYWEKGEKIGISKDDLRKIGITDGRVWVSRRILKPLLGVDRYLRRFGHRLYILEGRRKKKLYGLVYENMKEKWGKSDADKVLNTKDMPHSKGLSVDVAIQDMESGKLLETRDREDKRDAYFYGFYLNHKTQRGKMFHARQEFMITAMRAFGFELGSKGEYFHFNYVKKNIFCRLAAKIKSSLSVASGAF